MIYTNIIGIHHNWFTFVDYSLSESGVMRLLCLKGCFPWGSFTKCLPQAFHCDGINYLGIWVGSICRVEVVPACHPLPFGGAGLKGSWGVELLSRMPRWGHSAGLHFQVTREHNRGWWPSVFQQFVTPGGVPSRWAGNWVSGRHVWSPDCWIKPICEPIVGSNPLFLCWYMIK